MNLFKFDPNDSRWTKIFIGLSTVGVFVETTVRGEYPRLDLLMLLFAAASIVSLLLQAHGFCKKNEQGKLFVLTTFTSFIFGPIIATIVVAMCAEGNLAIIVLGYELSLSGATQAEGISFVTAGVAVAVICMYLAYYDTGLMSRLLRRDLASDIMFPEPVSDLLAELELEKHMTLADAIRTQLGNGDLRSVLAVGGVWDEAKAIFLAKNDDRLATQVQIAEYLISKRRYWSLCKWDWTQLLDSQFMATLPADVQRLVNPDGDQETQLRAKKKRKKRKCRRKEQRSQRRKPTKLSR